MDDIYDIMKRVQGRRLREELAQVSPYPERAPAGGEALEMPELDVMAPEAEKTWEQMTPLERMRYFQKLHPPRTEDDTAGADYRDDPGEVHWTALRRRFGGAA